MTFLQRLQSALRLIGVKVAADPKIDLVKFVPVLTEVVKYEYQRQFKIGARRFLENVSRKHGVRIVKKATLVFDFALFNRRSLDFVNEFAYVFARSTLETAARRVHETYALFKQELRDGLIEGEPQQVVAQRLRGVFNDDAKARTISQTEISRAVHAGQHLAANQSGIVRGKVWLPSNDACPFCQGYADRGEVPINEPFGIRGTGPYARIMYPPGHPHCFCTYVDIVG